MAESVLVTGGAGYIGSVVVSQLLEQGYQVIVYDNLSKGRLASVPANAKFIQGDISDHAALDRLFQENSIDAVMHFAAFIEAGESMQVPEKYFRNNTAQHPHSAGSNDCSQDFALCVLFHRGTFRNARTNSHRGD